MAREIRLLRLSLRNFKGIRDFTLDARGGNVAVYGDNATGKTTLADAWFWLLFDKDSANRKDFEIKTIDASGQPIHHLDHEVEGVVEVDGRQITLRKVYRELWTKKRGSATAEFSGHTTDYFVDGVPVKKAEYQARVDAIADESTFRLLTDPRFFNEQLHWQKRRELLLQVCGDVTDAEVIASDRALAELPEILRGRSLEDHRKVIAARRRQINEELQRIPVRIDEANRALPEVTGNREELVAQIQRLTEQRQAKATELARIDNGGEIAEKQKQLREIEIECLNLQLRLREGIDRAVQQERARLAEVNDRADAIRREIRRLQLESQEADRQIEVLQTRLQRMREEWAAINAREFTLTVEEVCPACGQALPAEQVQAARERALAEFNAKKSSDLEANVTEGKRLRGQLDQLLADQKRRSEEIERAQVQLAILEDQAGSIQARIDELRSRIPDPAQDPEYQAKQRAKADLEQQIADLRAGAAATRQQVTQEIANLDAQISTLRGELARIEQRHQLEARIEELKAQEKALAAEFERLEHELYLCDQFVVAKVRLLEEKINSRFKLARFKLFDTQINGGVTECCETTYQGVPYSNLNTGAKLNVGLDVINTLSDFYGFTAPIWVDNREAVTRLIPTRAQLISLVVSEPDKRLRVEVENTTTSLLQREAV